MAESPRFLSALILSLVALAIIIWGSSLAVELVYGVVIGLAAHEWAQLVPLGKIESYGFVLLTIMGMVVVSLFHFIGRTWIIPVTALFWLLVPWLIFGRKNHLEPVWAVFLGWLILVGAWYALVALSWGEGPPHWLLMSFLLLVCGADSGAYVAGKLWGRHVLAPTVSPKKTWEGVWGAGGVIFMVLIFVHFIMKTPLFTLLPLGFLVWYFSILGDLFESRLKRWRGVKDSGRIIPGHGGVLDRIDSWMAAAPIFLLFWNSFVR